jgi:hypothetical protein
MKRPRRRSPLELHALDGAVDDAGFDGLSEEEIRALLEQETWSVKQTDPSGLGRPASL